MIARREERSRVERRDRCGRKRSASRSERALDRLLAARSLYLELIAGESNYLQALLFVVLVELLKS
jgi:hypothetical protein